MKNVYLTAAIVGAVVPYIFFVSFLGETGAGLVSNDPNPLGRTVDHMVDELHRLLAVADVAPP